MVEVGSPGFIAGYLLTLINYGCYCTSRFVKTKRMMLVLDLTSKVLLVLGTFCLGAFSGSVAMILMIICLLASVYKENHIEKFKGAINWIVFLILVGMHGIIFLFFYQGISSILVVTTNVIALICIWWLRPQPIRFLGAINSVIFFLFQMSIGNLVGILEVIVFGSNVASFIKYYGKNEDGTPKKNDGDAAKKLFTRADKNDKIS